MSDAKKTTNEFLCSGFFVATNEGNAKAQSLFVCERKTFDDYCTRLIQSCQCQASGRKMIKIVQQVYLADSNELTECSLDVYACISERTCHPC